VRFIFAGRGDIRVPYMEVELPGVGLLQAGADGRRWLFPPSGPMQSAQTIAGSPLVGLVRDGARYAFVGARGDVYFAPSPLGSFSESRPGATTESDSHTAVGRALLVHEKQTGSLYRSGDLARTWQPVTQGAELSGSARVLRFNESSACVEVATAKGRVQKLDAHIIVAPRDPAHAFLLLAKDAEHVEVRPVACLP
jgi:hypothetical protein